MYPHKSHPNEDRKKKGKGIGKGKTRVESHASRKTTGGGIERIGEGKLVGQGTLSAESS